MIKPTIREVKTSKGLGYAIQVKYFDTALQKYKYKKITYYPDPTLTKKQAEHEATLYADKFMKDMFIQRELSGNELDGRKVTLEEYSQIWLEKIKKEKSHNFYYHANSTVEKMNKVLGHYKLRDLTPTIIQNYFNSIDKELHVERVIKAKPDIKEVLRSYGFKHRQTRKLIETTSLCHLYEGYTASINWGNRFSKITGVPFDEIFDIVDTTHELAISTRLGKKKVLRQILADAKRKGLVEHNYATAEYIEYPKGTKAPIKTMSADEMTELYGAILRCKDIKIKTALMIFFLMGFRRGEVGGLEWNDIDFENGLISVNRTVSYTPGFGTYEKKPKTELSKRVVSAAPELMEQLKKYKDWCIENGFDVSSKLFLNEEGGLLTPDAYDRWLEIVFRDTNIKEHYTLHSLRHSNIAYLISKGVDPVTVAKRAGHSRVSTTLDIYSYAFDHVDKSAALLTSDMGKKQKTNVNVSVSVTTTTEDASDNISDYKKVKAEMQRLGFEKFEEYYDYMEYLDAKKKKSVQEM